ncbi:alpha/beta fold hydrolase [Bacillus sp. OK048]|uniref:alpha/beta fold hydrolase n=1 Tax=Bacillus sp. OK048 TaxID=1882761 RepID=UPI0008914768|nr:alpha/beta hydrolase [Bacillus sp. OK048]SDM76139.1 Pimeloyl-ACP methyl ester carboxylesterase [Bacillus sp. OK048]
MEEKVFYRNQQVNNIDIYYEFYSNPDSTKTLVLLHGFLSSTFSYRRLIPYLNKEFQVVSIDLPPFGKSGKSSKFVYSYSNLAQTVIQLIHSLDLKDITLIGHSMGGQIVLNILNQQPDIAERAVLLCSSSYSKRLRLPLIISSYIPYFHLYVKFWLARSGVRQNLQNVVHDHSLLSDEMLFGYLQPFLEDEIFLALTRMIRDREGDLSTGALNQIAHPCLLIWGEHDKVVPLTVGERLKNDLRKSELVILKETGHLVPEERPEDVFQYIKQFLA